MTTSIQPDADMFEQGAHALFDRLVVKFATDLNNSGKHSITFENPTQDDLDLLFNLCFNSLILFESGQALDATGTEYTHVLFGASRTPDGPLFASPSRTQLHGLVDDDLIRQALRNAAEPAPVTVDGEQNVG